MSKLISISTITSMFWPRLIAKSSTPSTRGVDAARSGRAITSRNKVERLAAADSARARRQPRPASATAMFRSIPASSGVLRPYGQAQTHCTLGGDGLLAEMLGSAEARKRAQAIYDTAKGVSDLYLERSPALSPRPGKRAAKPARVQVQAQSRVLAGGRSPAAEEPRRACRARSPLPGEQALHRHRAVPPVKQACNDRGQGGGCLAAVSASVVEQYHRAVPHTGQHALDN